MDIDVFADGDSYVYTYMYFFIYVYIYISRVQGLYMYAGFRVYIYVGFRDAGERGHGRHLGVAAGRAPTCHRIAVSPSKP